MMTDDYSVRLKAEPAAVMAFLSRGADFTRLLPADVGQVFDVQERPEGGFSYRTTIRFFRVGIDTFVESIEVTPTQLRLHTQGGFEVFSTYAVEPLPEGGSLLTMRFEYEIPPTLLMQASRPLINATMQSSLTKIGDNARRLIR